MARPPITQRTGFYYPINRYQTQRVLLDWNAVETELGTMVEPRTLIRYIDGSVPQIDLLDVAFDREIQMTPDQFQNQYNHGGPQLMAEFTY